MEVSMENQPFDVLEEKINNILLLIGRLQNENRELDEKNQELHKKCEEKEENIRLLKEECDRYRNMKNEVASCKEKEDRIKLKVETLLSKLKEFENIT